MNKPGLTLAFLAASVIASRRIVIFKDHNDNEVKQANMKTDGLFGVTSDLDVALGEPVDVVINGSANVEYGATVIAGQLLTTDDQGRAIPATDNCRTIGVAMQNGHVKDIGSVLISPSLTN